MNTIKLLVVLGTLALAGCGSSPKGAVSKDQLADIRKTAHAVQPGMMRPEVMARYKTANLVRLSSTRIEDATIEEWKAEAYNDSKNGRDLSVQFLYFRNDVLVDASDARLDFRADHALVDRWSHQPAAPQNPSPR